MYSAQAGKRLAQVVAGGRSRSTYQYLNQNFVLTWGEVVESEMFARRFEEWGSGSLVIGIR